MRWLLLLLMTPCISLGQQYHPLPDSNATWAVVIISFIGADYAKFTIGGDTTINGEKYKIIDTDYYPNNFRAIRELPNKQVFIYRNPPDTATLLYDFSVGIGDSILPPMGWGYYLIVDNIDSVLIGNEYRRRWHFIYSGYPSQSEYWIEGIGSSRGLTFAGALQVNDSQHHLACFEQDDQVLYATPTYHPYCDSILGSTSLDKSPAKSLHIHPNPSSGLFTVSGAGEIQVFDLFGRLVLRTNKEEIDMSSYPAGIYMVRVGEAVRKLILQ